MVVVHVPARVRLRRVVILHVGRGEIEKVQCWERMEGGGRGTGGDGDGYKAAAFLSLVSHYPQSLSLFSCFCCF